MSNKRSHNDSLNSLLKNTQTISDETLERAEDSHTPRRCCNNRVKVIVTVILSIVIITMFSALSMMVIHLNGKVKYIEKQGEQQEAIPLDIIQNKETTVTPNFIEEQPVEVDIIANEEPSFIHLTGSFPIKSLRRGKGDGMYVVDIWNESKTVVDPILKLADKRIIEVYEDGLYKIYAQLSWRMSKGMATFIIQKNDQEPRVESMDNLAQCISSFSQSYATLKSCYTSMVIQLNKGDRLSVAVHRDNLTLDFQNGRSFFGVALLH